MYLLKEVIVSYDIVNNKSRKKVHDSLLDLGLISIQYSVFFGRLNQAELSAMNRILEKYIDRESDKSFFITGNFSIQLMNQCIGYSRKDIFENKDYEII
jgi:CRISPR-associated endonuclease Cas2